jgi:hypothetical protein
MTRISMKRRIILSLILILKGSIYCYSQTPGTHYMKNLLDSISVKMIELADSNYSEVYVKLKWFGNLGADSIEITEAEKRLNVNLPDDYVEFIGISNGFHAFSDVHPSFMPIKKIDYLINIDPELIEIWNEEGSKEIGIALEKSIMIGGHCEEQYFLLIPPDSKSDKWKYWEFSSWRPGVYEFSNLIAYFKNSLDFLTNQIIKQKQ